MEGLSPPGCANIYNPKQTPSLRSMRGEKGFHHMTHQAIALTTQPFVKCHIKRGGIMSKS